MSILKNKMLVSENIDPIKKILNISHMGYIIIDTKGIVIEINQALCKLSQFSSEELIGKQIHQIVFEPYHPVINDIIANLSTSAHQKVYCIFEIHNHILINVILHFISVNNETGELEGAFIIIDDVVNENSIQIDKTLVHNVFLEDSEASLFNTILENSRDVVYIINYHDVKFEFISPSILEMTGYSRDEFLTMNKTDILNIIHSDYREIFKNHWKNLKNKPVKTKNYFPVEFKIRPKIGISRWLSDNRKLIWDSNGELSKVVGNIRDITDFKLVEDALNRSRDRLTKAIDATNDGMWDWKLDSNKVYFDARFYIMAGYLPNEFPHSISEWMKRIHPNDSNNVQIQLDKHLHGRSDQWICEYRFRTKSDDWIWILNRGKIFERDEHGNALRMVGTHTDISLRKKMAEELQKRNHELEAIHEKLVASEEKFRQLAENTQDVFWLADKENLLYINPTFEKIWGQRWEVVINNPYLMSQWIHPDDIQTFHHILDLSILEKNQPYNEKFRIIRPNGEIRWIWSRRFPVLNENNEIYRIAGIASDITSQKVIEDDLIATREKALESDRLKSAFLANISHEIRTPMNGIIGFTGLLKEENLTFENRIQYLNIITKSGEQLLHIIDDIIDISKIESNQIKINYTDVNLNELIADLKLFYENVKKQIGKDHIEIIGNLKTVYDNIKLYNDESRLRQIFMNLISNALKFTDRGYIKFGYNLTPENKVEFYVEDTGIGISPEMQLAIFKRFRQVDESTTRTFGGTGLGLAISEGLIKLMHGKIWLKSLPGEGSKFYFSLPFMKDRSSTPKSPAIVDSDHYDWSGFVILIVEDDAINQEFLSTILMPTNVTIIQSYTAENAISVCESDSKIHLVLMDIRLPQMNGYEAYQIIAKLRPALPVVAQTAFALTEDANRCIEMGFANYIAKPIIRRNLLSMINVYLSSYNS